MTDDEEISDIEEAIRVLQGQIRDINHLLRFHGLDKVHIKYRKAFVKPGEYPFFEAKGFKEFNPNVQRLGNFQFSMDIAENWPKDPKAFEEAKKRMKGYAKMAKKKRKKRTSQ